MAFTLASKNIPKDGFEKFIFYIIRYGTWLGNIPTQLFICLFICYFIDFQKGFYITGLWGWAYFINLIIKNSIKRSRPNPSKHKIYVSGYSFPSGHSLTSFALYFAILKFFQLPEAYSYAILALPFLMGLSRLYLKVHYISDVLGGWLIAYAYLELLGPWINKMHAPFFKYGVQLFHWCQSVLPF